MKFQILVRECVEWLDIEESFLDDVWDSIFVKEYEESLVRAFCDRCSFFSVDAWDVFLSWVLEWLFYKLLVVSLGDGMAFMGEIWVLLLVKECVEWLDVEESFIDDIWDSMFIIALESSKDGIWDSFFIGEYAATGELWKDDLLLLGFVVESIENLSIAGEPLLILEFRGLLPRTV